MHACMLPFAMGPWIMLYVGDCATQVTEMKKVVQQKQVVVAQAKADCEELLVEIVQDKRVADEQEKQVCLQGVWRHPTSQHPMGWPYSRSYVPQSQLHGHLLPSVSTLLLCRSLACTAVTAHACST